MVNQKRPKTKMNNFMSMEHLAKLGKARKKAKERARRGHSPPSNWRSETSAENPRTIVGIPGRISPLQTAPKTVLY